MFAFPLILKNSVKVFLSAFNRMFLKKWKGKFIFCLGETVTPVVSMLSQVKTMFALSANIAMVVFTCVFNSVI